MLHSFDSIETFGGACWGEWGWNWSSVKAVAASDTLSGWRWCVLRGIRLDAEGLCCWKVVGGLSSLLLHFLWMCVSQCCQLDRIQNHLRDGPLGVLIREYLDYWSGKTYHNCEWTILRATGPGRYKMWKVDWTLAHIRSLHFLIVDGMWLRNTCHVIKLLPSRLPLHNELYPWALSQDQPFSFKFLLPEYFITATGKESQPRCLLLVHSQPWCVSSTSSATCEWSA